MASNKPMHFLDIRVLPCKNPSDVIKNVKSAVVSGAEKNSGKVIWLFKVSWQSHLALKGNKNMLEEG